MQLIDYTYSIKEIVNHYLMSDIILVGHSFGGRIAIQYASLYKSVDKLVLVDSAGIKPRRTLKYYYKIIKYKIKKRLKLNVSNMGSQDYRALSDIMKATFKNIVNLNLKKRLKTIYSKTLIIWGKNDRETPYYMAKIINKGIKNSKLITYHKGGHYSYLNNKLQFINDLTTFLEV